MFRTEVKEVLSGYFFERIKQKEGVVRVDFISTLGERDKAGIKEALKKLITPSSRRDIFVSLEEENGYTSMFVYTGDYFYENPVIFFNGF